MIADMLSVLARQPKVSTSEMNVELRVTELRIRMFLFLTERQFWRSSRNFKSAIFTQNSDFGALLFLSNRSLLMQETDTTWHYLHDIFVMPIGIM